MVYYPKGVSRMKEWFHRHKKGLKVTGIVLACVGGCVLIFLGVFMVLVFGMDTGLSEGLKALVGH